MEMTRTWQNRASTTLADFPFIPYLSERLNDNILKWLSPSVSTGMTLKCTPLSSLWEDWVPAMHILASPAESTQSRDSTWAFPSHVSIASILRQILFVNDSNATIFTHIFLLTWRNSEFFSMGLSLFLASLSSIYSQQEIRGIILTRSVSPVKQL